MGSGSSPGSLLLGMERQEGHGAQEEVVRGKTEREVLVKAMYATGYADAQSSLPRSQYGNDDLLDAFAALWSGERVVAGTEFLIPAEPPLDGCGLRMEIVA